MAALGLCATVVGLWLGGCASIGSQGQARCSFASCGEDMASLVKVTADALGVAPDTVTILKAERQFNGAVMIWRATSGQRRYDCKEGRSPSAPAAVHYVDCRPAGTGSLIAFP